jgi:hypothetical protein
LLTSWIVSLAGVVVASTNSTVKFAEPNGTHLYTVRTTDVGYMPSLYSGTVKLDGSRASVQVNFVPTITKAYFDETGLPPRTNWSVSVVGQRLNSTLIYILFEVLNGTYVYTVGPVPGYSAIPSSGVVTVNWTTVAVSIQFATAPATIYTLTFQESGLAPDAIWSVAINSISVFSNGTTTVDFELPNGSYAYQIGVSGSSQLPHPGSGYALVSGHSTTVSVTFTAAQCPCGAAGFEFTTTDGVALGVSLALVAIALVAIVFWRRQQHPPVT